MNAERTAYTTPLSLNVEEIGGGSALQGMEDCWNRLVQDTGCVVPFLRHEWIATWWEAFGAGRELQVLVVREGGEPIALVPLMAGPARVCGLTLRRLEFPSNAHTPRFECPVSRLQDAVHTAVWEHVRQSRSWDVIQLRDLPRGSAFGRGICGLAESDGYLTGFWPSSEAPYVPLRGAFSVYLAGLRAKHRSNLRNRFKRLARVGEVALETLDSPSSDALDEAFQIEASGWKGRVGTAIAGGVETDRFYRRFAERASEKGWLRLYFLRCGSRRIAFQYCLEYRGRLWVLKLGFDPEFAPLSPQNLLCARILEDAHLRGLERYEFLGDREEWKLEWTQATEPHEWVFVFRNDALGRFLHTLKFRVVPRLREQPGYRLVRDAFFPARVSR